MSRLSASVGFSPTRWKGARKMPNFIPLWVMGSPMWVGSAGRLARVDGEHLAGKVPRRRAAQERGGGRDVGGGGHPLEGRALQHGLAHGLGRDPAHPGLALDDAVDAVAL